MKFPIEDFPILVSIDAEDCDMEACNSQVETDRGITVLGAL